MKFGSQIGLALLAIVGLVAGVTYLSHYRVTPPPDVAVKGPARDPGPEKNKEAARPKTPELTFPITNWVWDPPAAGEFEKEGEGYVDFWFQNSTSVGIDLGVTHISCKCSGVSLCVLTPEEVKRYQPWALSSAGFQTFAGFRGILGLLSQKRIDEDLAPEKMGLRMDWLKTKRDNSNKWVLSNDSENVVVPAGSGGLARVQWKGKNEKIGEERLAIELWSQPKTVPSPRTDTRLEVAVRFVPTLRALPLTFDFQEINQRDQKTTAFVCWSSVRGWFPLSAMEAQSHPCIQCTCTPLTPEECSSFSQSLPVRPLYGYWVRVAVNERLSDLVQMDLGPFSRRILLKSSDPSIEDMHVTITGTVRGEVTVGNDEDGGRVMLGTFKSAKGKSKVVRLTAAQPGTVLQFERVEPATADFVRVKHLKEVQQAGGGSRWELSVEIPPNSPTGKIPDHTAIILKMPGNPVRHIRIPVVGTSYQ